MWCSVPFCRNTSDNVFRESHGKIEDRGIGFYGFPSEPGLRAAWLEALGMRDTDAPDSAVVCSRHFLNDDIRDTESGSRLIEAGAVPSTVLVCMLCLETGGDLLLLSKHKLEEPYEKLTGYPLHDQRNLKQTVCVQCVQRLTDFSRFREQSLRARSRMMVLVEKHEFITIKLMKMIDCTILQPTLCQIVKVEHSVEDKQTDLHKTTCTTVDTSAVKNEKSCESVTGRSVDEEFPNKGSTLAKLLLGDAQYESVNREPAVAEHMPSSDSNMNNGRVTEVYDVKHPGEPVPIKEEPLSETWNIDTVTDDSQYDATVPSVVSVTKHKSEVSSIVQSQADWLNVDHHIQSNSSLDNSLLVEIKRFTCDICRKSLKTKSILTRHIKSHMEVKEYACTFCQYKSKSERNVTEHLRMHLLNEKCYSCKLCDYKTVRNRYFVSHMRTHTGEKPYSCKLCDYKAIQKCNLVCHMRTHTGEKPYSCRLCDHKFTIKTNLVHHMKIHTGEKPFSCQVCQYKTARSRDLVRHTRTHTGEKPYACELCEYKTAVKSCLICHMRTHTGEKPYSCKVCDYKATHKSSLRLHTQTHAPTRTASRTRQECAQKSFSAAHR